LRAGFLDPISPALAEAYVALANCDAELGDFDRAKALAAQAGAILAAHKRLGGQYVAPLRDLTKKLARRRFQ